MKHSLFYSFAVIAIGFLLYLNFSSSKKQAAPPLVIDTPGAPKPIGPYAQAIRKGNALFVSGQIAIDPATGRLDTADIAAETKRVLSNINAILLASGMTMKDIAKTTIYLTNLDDFKTVNEIYGAAFGAGPYPARETVQVAGLPKGAHLEISVVAAR
jgi:2-iminobutanoate/2-iminopropanoate deaminase